jgi:tetratricopeptide (TPR) repeat protein
MRFAIEAIVFTLLVSGLMMLTGASLQPVFFLVLLYLITMRVRVLVDLGTIFAKRGNFKYAERIYQFAMNLWPDMTGHMIIQVNQATKLLQQGKLDAAIASFTDVLSQAESGYLGIKYEVAAHYNLGVAYQRKGLDAQATIAFNAALDTWPASEYARRAEAALKKHRRKKSPSTSKEDT